MTFSSLQFICVFFPIVFILNLVLPNIKARNVMLMIASLVFYAYGEPVYVLLMLFSSLLNYALARAVDAKEGKGKKTILIITVVVNLVMLGVFKYTDMIIGTINSLFKTDIPLTNIPLPIGISFFTFQAMSYVIDVYRHQEKAQKSYAKVLLYISFFPQLIAGPIVKYSDIAAEIDERKADSKDIAEGLKRFILGLTKKIMIAGAMGLAADKIYAMNSSDIVMLTAWIGALAYMFQIYFDFSGYSDMAIGLGRMFGFHFKENFNHPYSADSIQDFWRRWHISLTSWFRDYLYIPLGGNRKGKARTWINRMIIFFCTGLWHGASWTFVIWGLYHGLFLMLETVFPKFTKKLGILRFLYVVVVVCVGFVFFRADTLGQAIDFIVAMFSKPIIDSSVMVSIASIVDGMFIFMLIISVIASLPTREWIGKIVQSKLPKCVKAYEVLGYAVSIVLLFVNICFLAGGTYNPFIYFRF